MNKHRLKMKENKLFPAKRTLAWKKHSKRISFYKMSERRMIYQLRKDNEYLVNLFWLGESKKPQTGFLEEGC
jgi:hypothetical protein